jgi:hypothetical protein
MLTAENAAKGKERRLSIEPYLAKSSERIHKENSRARKMHIFCSASIHKWVQLRLSSMISVYTGHAAHGKSWMTREKHAGWQL